MMTIEAKPGTVKTRYNYSPFGDTEAIGEASGNSFQYTGRENDGGTGLYYYRARYYSPEMGRFISEDPIGLLGGVNYFAYVGNSPCNFTDPLGLDPGDIFPTAEEAAIDAIEYIWASKSDWKEVEYGGWVVIADEGFTYEEPIRGTAGGVPKFPPKTEGCASAWYHTHNKPRWFNRFIDFFGMYRYPGGENFSTPEDLNISDVYKSDAYLGTPSQRILRYKPGDRRTWESRVEEIKRR